MKDGHTTKSESSFGKKLWCVLIALFLGVIGWQVWKLNAYNNAVRQAKEAGFRWICYDTLSLIRQDWHNAFKKATWSAHDSVLDMLGSEVRDLSRYRQMLHHLRPTILMASKCEDENVDGLMGLTGLRDVHLHEFHALKNVDGLKGLNGLQKLDLRYTDALQNVDGLKGLVGLQTLYLYGCDKIPAVALRELREALPNTDITFPDGSENPPQ